MQPEIILWFHVISRNFIDSLGLTDPNCDKADWIIQKQAKNWIGKEDFNYICDLIDIEPKNVLQIYEEIKKRQTSFSQEEISKFILSGLSRFR